jgi:hypothetical protein
VARKTYELFSSRVFLILGIVYYSSLFIAFRFSLYALCSYLIASNGFLEVFLDPGNLDTPRELLCILLIPIFES